MSALIKQGAAEVTLALPLGAPPEPRPAVKPDPRDAEIARLKAEIATLNERLLAADKAKVEARERGRQAGLAEAEDRSAERLVEVRDALDDAARRFENQLVLLDGLAPSLARAALEKLFVPAEHWAAMAEAMIARQLQALRRSADVILCVSPEDFDAAGIAGIGAGQCRVEVDPDLPSGAARILCRLDRIDLDVREQWAGLAALLDAMARDAA